ncbi:hypothetical protein FO519_005432 [Halicephalobus sp. NKZ332]|nr:hypothetical protein FO519_005432 [Halicephalobus sp. NKZ332]
MKIKLGFSQHEKIIFFKELKLIKDTYTNLLEASDYQPIMFRQERDPMKNPLPHVPGRRLAWNMLIRPGMAGGFKKRVSEREINSLLKNTWLG